MKYFFQLIMVATALFSVSGGPAAAGAAEITIGVLDMEKLQARSVAFEEVRKALEGKFQAIKEKMDAEKEALRSLEEEYNKASMMLSLDAKEDRQREIEKKRRRFKFMYEESLKDMKDLEMETTKIVGKEIGSVVEKLGKQQGFTLILEKRTIGLLYFDSAIDITDQIIEAYDKAKQ
jgi:outer membrane protein